MDTTIYKSLMGSDQDGAIYEVDTIKYRDQLWLVPHWLQAHGSKWKYPTRIISLEGAKVQELGGDSPDFLLGYPVPKAVLDGETTDGYTVIESPNLKFPSQKRLN